ncbi:MAG TPA: response regulator transcription factor [Actinomycetota bacterium]
MRRLLILTDRRPGDVLPAAHALGTDVKTDSLDAGGLARVPDLGPDLVVADSVPDPERCFGLLRELRARGGPPALVVLGRDQLAILPWQEVADDFVHPETGEDELRLRVELLRSRVGETGEGVLRLGPVAINTLTYRVTAGGRALDLTFKEFELLRFLAQHEGRVFTRAQLLREVWGYDFYGGTRTVDVHVRRLRAKLGPEHEHLIETVRSVGYRASSGEPPLD